MAMTNDANRKLPPYALILAPVLGRPRGGVAVRLTLDDGKEIEVCLDDSCIAPLTTDEATGNLNPTSDWLTVALTHKC